MPKGTCAVDGCEGEASSRGWCGKHYQRWRKFGDPLHPAAKARGESQPLVNRLARYIEVDHESGCWNWTGSKDPRGYGRISITTAKKKRPRPAYRVLWEELVGPVDAGHELDHLCRNPSCCNPDHLEPVTHYVNVLRGDSVAARNARKTHCKRGHEFTPENTWINPTSGGRQCRACLKLRKRGRTNGDDRTAASA